MVSPGGRGNWKSGVRLLPGRSGLRRVLPWLRWLRWLGWRRSYWRTVLVLWPRRPRGWCGRRARSRGAGPRPGAALRARRRRTGRLLEVAPSMAELHPCNGATTAGGGRLAVGGPGFPNGELARYHHTGPGWVVADVADDPVTYLIADPCRRLPSRRAGLGAPGQRVADWAVRCWTVWRATWRASLYPPTHHVRPGPMERLV